MIEISFKFFTNRGISCIYCHYKTPWYSMHLLQLINNVVFNASIAINKHRGILCIIAVNI